MNTELKTFCPCGRLIVGCGPWAEHLQTCSRLREVLQANKPGMVEVRYPDFAKMSRTRVPWYMATDHNNVEEHIEELCLVAGVPVIEAPITATLIGDHIQVFTGKVIPTWAVVVIAYAKNKRTATKAMKLCMRGGDSAVKTLVTLIRLAPDKNYEAAVDKFIGAENAYAKMEG